MLWTSGNCDQLDVTCLTCVFTQYLITKTSLLYSCGWAGGNSAPGRGIKIWPGRLSTEYLRKTAHPPPVSPLHYWWALCWDMQTDRYDPPAGFTGRWKVQHFFPSRVFFNLSRLWCERWNERSELAGSCDLNRTFNFFDKSNVLMNGDGPLVCDDR